MMKLISHINNAEQILITDITKFHFSNDGMLYVTSTNIQRFEDRLREHILLNNAVVLDFIMYYEDNIIALDISDEVFSIMSTDTVKQVDNRIDD